MDKKRILVVDDEVDQVSMVKKRLEAVGYDVDEAYCGEEAIGKVRAVKPDLIILDVMMTGMDGYQVCSTLGSEKGCSDIPIIMLTALSQAQDIRRGMDSGAVSFVQKPFKLDVLLGIIKGVLG